MDHGKDQTKEMSFSSIPPTGLFSPNFESYSISNHDYNVPLNLALHIFQDYANKRVQGDMLGSRGNNEEFGKLAQTTNYDASSSPTTGGLQRTAERINSKEDNSAYVQELLNAHQRSTARDLPNSWNYLLSGAASCPRTFSSPDTARSVSGYRQARPHPSPITEATAHDACLPNLTSWPASISPSSAASLNAFQHALAQLSGLGLSSPPPSATTTQTPTLLSSNINTFSLSDSTSNEQSDVARLGHTVRPLPGGIVATAAALLGVDLHRSVLPQTQHKETANHYPVSKPVGNEEEKHNRRNGSSESSSRVIIRQLADADDHFSKALRRLKVNVLPEVASPNSSNKAVLSGYSSTKESKANVIKERRSEAEMAVDEHFEKSLAAFRGRSTTTNLLFRHSHTQPSKGEEQRLRTLSCSKMLPSDTADLQDLASVEENSSDGLYSRPTDSSKYPHIASKETSPSMPIYINLSSSTADPISQKSEGSGGSFKPKKNWLVQYGWRRPQPETNTGHSVVENGKSYHTSMKGAVLERRASLEEPGNQISITHPEEDEEDEQIEVLNLSHSDPRQTGHEEYCPRLKRSCSKSSDLTSRRENDEHLLSDRVHPEKSPLPPPLTLEHSNLSEHPATDDDVGQTSLHRRLSASSSLSPISREGAHTPTATPISATTSGFFTGSSYSLDSSVGPIHSAGSTGGGLNSANGAVLNNQLSNGSSHTHELPIINPSQNNNVSYASSATVPTTSQALCLWALRKRASSEVSSWSTLKRSRSAVTSPTSCGVGGPEGVNSSSTSTSTSSGDETSVLLCLHPGAERGSPECDSRDPFEISSDNEEETRRTGKASSPEVEKKRTLNPQFSPSHAPPISVANIGRSHSDASTLPTYRIGRLEEDRYTLR